MDPLDPVPAVDVAAVVSLLRSRALTVGCAESLTAGLVAARLADVPGASAVLRGGVVAYATDVKAGVLGVDQALLDARGPVDEDVALAMAAGAARLLGADVGVATTGVAGPGPADGVAAGTVVLAVAGPDGASVGGAVLGSGADAPGEGASSEGVLVRRVHLGGDRVRVREASVRCALALLARWAEPGGASSRRPGERQGRGGR